MNRLSSSIESNTEFQVAIGENIHQNDNRSLYCYSQKFDNKSIEDIFSSIEDEPHFYWKDRKAGITYLGLGVCERIEENSIDRYRLIEQSVNNLFSNVNYFGDSKTNNKLSLKIFGGFSFFIRHKAVGIWNSFPRALFVLPKLLFQQHRDGSNWVTICVKNNQSISETQIDNLLKKELEGVLINPNSPQDFNPEISEIGKDSDKNAWISLVEKAKSIITMGGFTKVVLARPFSLQSNDNSNISPVIRRLNNLYPSCFQFSFSPEKNQTFFGATPELLVNLDGNEIETVALAGSIKRGENQIDDDRQERLLMESAKNRHEHQLVVDAIQEQLASLADGKIKLMPLSIRKLKNIQHLQQKIKLKRKPRHSIFNFIEALHPTPALGGQPRIQALAFIQNSENFERGWYGGPIGFLDQSGDGCFAVAIRSGIKSEDHYNIFAGAGIVADSDAEKEWDETILKLSPLIEGITAND
jgi:menaquinone-specific isochorismate synthase